MLLRESKTTSIRDVRSQTRYCAHPVRQAAARQGHATLRPETVALAKRLRRASPNTGERLSLRQISAKLAEAGHLNERGQPYNAKSMLDASDLARLRVTRVRKKWGAPMRDAPRDKVKTWGGGPCR